jgi:hypothetical protein
MNLNDSANSLTTKISSLHKPVQFPLSQDVSGIFLEVMCQKKGLTHHNSSAAAHTSHRLESGVGRPNAWYCHSTDRR